MIDKLCLHRMPGDQSPAAWLLVGTDNTSLHIFDHAVNLKMENDDLLPGISPWLPHDQSLGELGDILPDEDHGVIWQFHTSLNRCEIIGFEPLGAFGQGLPNNIANQARNHLILAFNGSDVHTVLHRITKEFP